MFIAWGSVFMRQVFFDVETKKTFDEVGGYYPEKLGVSFVGLIVRDGFPEEGRGKETRHELFEEDLPKLGSIFESADVIIGFNSKGFDLPALAGFYPPSVERLPHIDMLEIVKTQCGHRISLDALAQVTLGTQKSGNGLDAITYYKNGDRKSLASYCMKDVEITRDLYDFGRKSGKVKFLNKWNNLTELPVDFTIKLPEAGGFQMSLV